MLNKLSFVFKKLIIQLFFIYSMILGFQFIEKMYVGTSIKEEERISDEGNLFFFCGIIY